MDRAGAVLEASLAMASPGQCSKTQADKCAYSICGNFPSKSCMDEAYNACIKRDASSE